MDNSDVIVSSAEQKSWKTAMKSRLDAFTRDMSMKASALRHNPGMITGLSGAAGLGLGLLGRWLRHRAHSPKIYFVEAY